MEFLFEILKSVVGKAVAHGVAISAEGFFQKRRIFSRVDDAVAKVLESLGPFFVTEGLTPDQQKLLFQVFSDEMEKLLDDPDALFKASLDGQKLYDRLYTASGLPREIVSGNLSHVYSLVFPQLANLVFVMPPLIAQLTCPRPAVPA